MRFVLDQWQHVFFWTNISEDFWCDFCSDFFLINISEDVRCVFFWTSGSIFS